MNTAIEWLPDSVPVPKLTGYGRTQRFVEGLRDKPGEWAKFPFEVHDVRTLLRKYPRRYPGTEWAVNTDGILTVRWIGT